MKKGRAKARSVDHGLSNFISEGRQRNYKEKNKLFLMNHVCLTFGSVFESNNSSINVDVSCWLEKRSGRQ